MEENHGMSKHPEYDFAGYVTRNDTRCTDGVIIRHGAFAGNDGQKVPLVWSHDHSNPDNIIGHVLLHNANDGVYGQGFFNGTPSAQQAKELVQHGDIWSMSIGANRIERTPSNDVIHGNIYEVSLVVAGANPGAVITEVLQHSQNPEEGETIIMESNELIHSSQDVLVGQERISLFDRIQHADEGEVTDIVDDVLSTLTPDQQEAVAILVEASTDSALENFENTVAENFDAAVEDQVDSILEELANSDDDEEEIEQSALGGNTMHYNAFQNVSNNTDELRHSLEDALATAKDSGRKLSQVLTEFEHGDTLKHSMNNLDLLFPDHALQGGIQVLYSPNTATEHILSRVTKVPTAFVKSLMTDLTNLTDEQLRAKVISRVKKRKNKSLDSFLVKLTHKQSTKSNQLTVTILSTSANNWM